MSSPIQAEHIQLLDNLIFILKNESRILLKELSFRKGQTTITKIFLNLLIFQDKFLCFKQTVFSNHAKFNKLC